MKFSICCNPKGHQTNYTNLMKAGLIRHGLQFEPNWRQEDVDFIVTWAYKPNRIGQRWHEMKMANKKMLVMERGYIGDRLNQWTSCGWDGLNGRANFCNKHITDLSRFNKYFSGLIKPWKVDKSAPILLCGQVAHDAAVEHANIHSWYQKIASQLINLGHTVIFREHPLSKTYFYFNGNLKRFIPDKSGSLEEALNKVGACITYNSNSGVISTLHGVPTVSWDAGSMVYDITKHDLSDLYYTPDRDIWAAQMAYTQWTDNEIEKGEPWENLKTYIQ